MTLWGGGGGGGGGALLCLMLQGEVTLIDSVLTPATAVKKFDLEFGP